MNDEKNIWVSIVSAVYNSMDTIEGMIQSVIKCKEENDDVEHIIIDGASKDGTVDIIKKYEHKIDFWMSEPDSGTSEAINKGIKRAKGEYILFLAADDRLAENAIEGFRKTVKPNIDGWFGSIKIVEGNRSFVVGSESDLDMLYYYCSLRLPAAFIKKSVYQELGGFSEKYKIANDHEFFLRMYTNGKIFQIEDCLVEEFAKGGNSEIYRDRAIDEDEKIAIEYGVDSVHVKKHFDKVRQQLQQINSSQPLSRWEYDFPFHRIVKGKRIVLYGAGNVGRQYYEQLLCKDSYELVCWVDQNAEKYEAGIEPIESIKNVEYDYVVIGIYSWAKVQQVKKTLSNMGVSLETILWEI